MQDSEDSTVDDDDARYEMGDGRAYRSWDGPRENAPEVTGSDTEEPAEPARDPRRSSAMGVP